MSALNNRGARRFGLLGVSSFAIGLALASGVSQAQTATEASSGDDVVVVTGYRESLKKALNVKRKSDMMIDAINAEDVGKFPESNLSEALQRLPGISIERDNGEGRTITVRGLGGDFVRTRLNGIETTATSGNNEGQTGINRNRGFDYNVFASDLFSSLKVLKSAQATVDEGSLGATIDIDTGRPLDFRKQKIVFSVQDTYYADDKSHNPRYAAMYSNTWFQNRLGFLFSAAYNKRETGLSFFDRNPGQFEVLYRGSDLAGPVQNGTGGTATPTCLVSGAPNVTATANSSPLNCFWGFALPTSYVGTGAQSFGIASTSQMFGSDPTAYALISANPATTIPALTSVQQQDLSQDRLGLTSTLQWKPTENTKVTIDALYAQFKVDNQSHILGSFGLNRQFDNARAEIGLTNTTTGLRPYSSANFNYFADRRGAYTNSCLTSATQDCTGTLGSPTTPVFSTAQYWNGTAYVLVPSVLATTTTNGNTWSTNPYNVDTYDYYNNPGSVGYNSVAAGTDRRGILMYDQIVGKPHTTIQDVHLNSAGQVDYMKLNRVDWLSNNAYSQNNTVYGQYDMTIDHTFNDSLKAQVVYGKSFSHLRMDGGRVDLFALDKDNFVYDERNAETMPIFNPGFNAADVNEFGDIVKGYAGIAIYQSKSNNRYETLRSDFNYILNDKFSVDFGLSWRVYEFENEFAQISRSVIPTIKELNKYGVATGKAEYANLKLSDMGHVVQFGAGLDLPAGTPTAWFSPDRDSFARLLGYRCNCVNEFADWRVIPTLGSGLKVQEEDLGQYAQLNFNVDVFGRALRGNAGVRVAKTDITSSAFGTTGVFANVALKGSNSYTDTLPSLNLAYEITDKLLVRFAAAKTMARPSLGNLGPGVSSLRIGATPVVTAPPSLTLGNPALKPYRSNNFDLNFEWYFQKDALLSLAVFHKDLGSFPRQERFLVKLDEFLPADLHAQIRSSLTPTQQAYMDGANEWNVTSYGDSPGGVVNGYEIQYQHNFTFLPAPFDGFGVQANLTHIDSTLAYLTQSGVWAKAPWPFASPDAINATLFYEKGPFEARISASWRDRFATVFPQSVGTCVPGLTTVSGGVCTSPFNDFGGVEAQTYVDAKMSYKFSKQMKFDLAVQNIFSEDESQWNYQPSVVRKYSAGGGRIISMGLRYSY